MSYHDIKPNAADRKFSDYIRAKRNWTCEYCGRRCRDWTGTTIFYKCEASHYFSRRYWNTRYDEENVRVLCFTCHKDLGGRTKNVDGPYDKWMKKILGEKKFKLLEVRANATGNKDPKLALLVVNQLIKNEQKTKN